MSSKSVIDVEHIARLARIELTEVEKEKFAKELAKILDFIDQLNKVDTENIEPLYQTTGLSNSYRSDEPRNSFVMDEDLTNKLIGQTPEHEGRFVKVKSVLEHKK
ncbi:MAG: Asp-tRNA(Asn)/Glu-tRNA(Gln) amidotransferase subunit GatC [Parcubacteria group bacterium]|nr:Asp-tRNA(Asn)/Glu-tRNA(Gln) amidotransferase subunit GatC [Parcubacteria group bacterium]